LSSLICTFTVSALIIKSYFATDGFQKCHKKAQFLLRKDEIESSEPEERNKKSICNTTPAPLQAPNGILFNGSVHILNFENSYTANLSF